MQQLEDREAAVADLETQQAELARQQEAAESLAAQLQRRSEAVAAEARAARDAAEVRHLHLPSQADDWCRMPRSIQWVLSAR